MQYPFMGYVVFLALLFSNDLRDFYFPFYGPLVRKKVFRLLLFFPSHLFFFSSLVQLFFLCPRFFIYLPDRFAYGTSQFSFTLTSIANLSVYRLAVDNRPRFLEDYFISFLCNTWRIIPAFL